MAYRGELAIKTRKSRYRIVKQRHRKSHVRNMLQINTTDNNNGVDDRYLSSQINNFDAILNSLRNERY